MHHSLLLLYVLVGALLLHLVVKYKSLPGIVPTKMLVSSTFIAEGLVGGGLETTYGRIVLGALALCWLGDLFLAYEGEGVFVAGLVSFLLSHALLIIAFITVGLSARWCAGAAIALVIICLPVIKWLNPHVPSHMKIPVYMYMFTIATMVILATGTYGAGHHVVLLTGALGFFFSDIFVARNHFVKPGFSNELLGLPLYFGGVYLIAVSVAFV